jgi:hypothetical protein
MKAVRTALFVALALAATSHAQYTAWSTPANLGPPVNTTSVEQAPFLSKDGLTLYFARSVAGSLDLWVSQRETLDDSWGTPQPLSSINSGFIENNAALSLDEHSLYFNSNRPGGLGENDLYVSRRHDKRNPLGWEPPVNLGPDVNSAFGDTTPTFFEDDATGVITMYFDSNRPGGQGDFDIYASSVFPDGTFSAAMPVIELNSSFPDRGPAVRRDGLEMFLQSERPGTGRVGGIDLMVSTRAATSEPWSSPVYLGSSVNSPFIDGAPAVSFKETALYFQSTRNSVDAAGPCAPNLGPCVFDLYVATRTKSKGSDD